MAWHFSSWELRYCTALGMVSPLHSMSSLQILWAWVGQRVAGAQGPCARPRAGRGWPRSHGGQLPQGSGQLTPQRAFAGMRPWSLVMSKQTSHLCAEKLCPTPEGTHPPTLPSLTCVPGAGKTEENAGSLCICLHPSITPPPALPPPIHPPSSSPASLHQPSSIFPQSIVHLPSIHPSCIHPLSMFPQSIVHLPFIPPSTHYPSSIINLPSINCPSSIHHSPSSIYCPSSFHPSIPPSSSPASVIHLPAICCPSSIHPSIHRPSIYHPFSLYPFIHSPSHPPLRPSPPPPSISKSS